MEFPQWKKKLKHLLSSVGHVAVISKNVILSAGLLSLASGQSAGQLKVPVDPRQTAQSTQITKFSAKYLLRAAARSGLSTLFSQHRSHSSHSSHYSSSSGSGHQSHASHSSHYSSSSPTPAPSHSSHSSHYSSTGPTTPSTRTNPSSSSPSPRIEITPPTSRSRRTTTSTVVFSDYFKDNGPDAEKWTLSSNDDQVSVQERDEHLEIIPTSEVPGLHFNGYISTSSSDMTAAHARVEVVQATSGSANTIFTLTQDGSHWYRFVKEGDMLYFQYKAGGAISSTSVPYNPAQHRFWRLRHDATNNLMLWETSADEETWAIRRKVTPLVPITALYIALNAGTYKAESDPGTAIFDSFKLVIHR